MSNKVQIKIKKYAIFILTKQKKIENDFSKTIMTKNKSKEQ